jgi:hypothetical protein
MEGEAGAGKKGKEVKIRNNVKMVSFGRVYGEVGC